MRDYFVFAVVMGSLPFILRRPWIGIIMWCWLSYMNPHKLSWSFAREMPFAMLVALATLTGMLFMREPRTAAADARNGDADRPLPLDVRDDLFRVLSRACNRATRQGLAHPVDDAGHADADYERAAAQGVRMDRRAVSRFLRRQGRHTRADRRQRPSRLGPGRKLHPGQQRTRPDADHDHPAAALSPVAGTAVVAELGPGRRHAAVAPSPRSARTRGARSSPSWRWR